MKPGRPADHQGVVPSTVEPSAPAPVQAAQARPADVTEVFRVHGNLVWTALQRFGIRDRDLPDVFQETLIVVHERLPSFQGHSQFTTWLYGVAFRVALRHRRRAWVRREEAHDVLPEPEPDDAGPSRGVELSEARAQVREVLDRMDVDKRAVFVMFEVDEMSCDEIARLLGVPVGTVYSRLHAARKQFTALAAEFVEARRQREHG